MAKYTVGVAGSTQHTVMCADALLTDERFEISWVLTPRPQPIGRKHIITPNPLHTWADVHRVPVIFVEKKLRPELSTQLSTQPDFLLVVDFGYLVPEWLLEFPKIAPVNIHPSLLPRWRGSSPGQFTLLDGEQTSAVTTMIMGKGLDTGPVLWQTEFAVGEKWTQKEYYHHSFTLAANALASVLQEVGTGKLLPQPQLDHSPTPIARRLKKEDGYISWKTLAALLTMNASKMDGVSDVDSSLIHDSHMRTATPLGKTIANAVRALSPWPGVWTIVPTSKGPKRLKILRADFSPLQELQLLEVQLEGQQPARWSDLRTAILQ